MKTNHPPLAPTSGERAPSSCLYLESTELGIDIPRRKWADSQMCQAPGKMEFIFQTTAGKGSSEDSPTAVWGRSEKWTFERVVFLPETSQPSSRVQTPLSWGNPFYAA